MQTATFRDMSLARSQNSLVVAPLAGYLNSGGHYGEQVAGNFLTYAFLTLSTIVLVFSGTYLYKSRATTDYGVSGAIGSTFQESSRDTLLVEKGAAA